MQKSETRNQKSERPEALHSGICILNSDLSGLADGVKPFWTLPAARVESLP